MNRDDIIKMAREAGFPFNKYGLLQGDEDREIDADEMFERFAQLIAEAERDRITKIVAPIFGRINAQLKTLEDRARGEK